ncbi:hypothetical protein JGG87_25515, partial [Salmonella enterica subsp. enterica serovar Typhimurium]|nr:hypothetical protein [Salmonella enterica subsp. enterica serovar Typhimurium]
MSLTPKNNSVWDMVRSLKSSRRRAVPSLREGGGGWISTSEGKCETFASLLEGKFGFPTFRGREDLQYQIKFAQEVCRTFADVSADELGEENQVHWTEIHEIVSNLKPKKSPGIDEIKPGAIKKQPGYYLMFLTDII